MISFLFQSKVFRQQISDLIGLVILVLLLKIKFAFKNGVYIYLCSPTFGSLMYMPVVFMDYLISKK